MPLLSIKYLPAWVLKIKVLLYGPAPYHLLVVLSVMLW
jgi:hypothetical protein